MPSSDETDEPVLSALRSYMSLVRRESLQENDIPSIAEWREMAAHLTLLARPDMVWADRLVVLCAAVDSDKRATFRGLN